jgi:hypothetical protein
MMSSKIRINASHICGTSFEVARRHVAVRNREIRVLRWLLLLCQVKREKCSFPLWLNDRVTSIAKTDNSAIRHLPALNLGSWRRRNLPWIGIGAGASPIAALRKRRNSRHC